jgi:hypothetical protein
MIRNLHLKIITLRMYWAALMIRLARLLYTDKFRILWLAKLIIPMINQNLSPNRNLSSRLDSVFFKPSIMHSLEFRCREYSSKILSRTMYRNTRGSDNTKFTSRLNLKWSAMIKRKCQFSVWRTCILLTILKSETLLINNSIELFLEEDKFRLGFPQNSITGLSWNKF